MYMMALRPAILNLLDWHWCNMLICTTIDDAMALILTVNRHVLRIMSKMEYQTAGCMNIIAVSPIWSKVR